MTIYEQTCREEARRRGIDPDIAVQAANTEGGVTEPARLGDFSGPPWYSGKSWWMFQLHYGGAGYEHFGNTAGMGNSFTEKTGWQPGDPNAWRDALRYALDRVKASGWGPWYGPAKIGIVGMRGIDPNFYWPGTPAHEWDYLKGKPVPVLPYNPDAPVDVQPNDWSCALQSVQWLLRSIGRNPDASDTINDPWLVSQLVPGIIRPDLGLLKATGEDLAAWLNREYGREMGFTAHYAPVTFDDVAAGAGMNPTIVGGRKYGPGGHWVGIRRLLPDGTLELANPAPNYDQTGPTLDRAEWDARGPWSAIWIDRAGAAAPAPDPVPEPPSRKSVILANIRTLLDELERTA